MKEIINFVEENVSGKTLFTKELVMNWKMVHYKAYTLTKYHFLILNTHKVDFSSVSLSRFELAKRKSTNAITGCFRFVSASGKNVAAEAVVSGIYDVHLENGVLKLSEDQALYRDQPIQDERYKPVAFQSEHRFYCIDRKLHYEYNGRSFDVDPETMTRSDSSDTFPPFISIEK